MGVISVPVQASSQESRCQLITQFRILIASVVKI